MISFKIFHGHGLPYTRELVHQGKTYKATYLRGGLGNGMFQVAAGLSLAHHNQDTFAIPDNPQLWVYNKYFEQPFDYVKIRDLEDPYIYEHKHVEYEPIEYKKGNTLLHGLFQNEQYFAECKEHILDRFTFKSDVIGSVKTKLDEISQGKPTCGVHVRRGDYVYQPSLYNLCSVDYYERAFTHIRKKYNNDVQFVIFSDDITWCKRTFIGEDFIFVESNTDAHQGEPSDIFDMMYMTLCSSNIVANSTFSWWGAWLNRNPDKTVITPSWSSGSWIGTVHRRSDPSTFYSADVSQSINGWIKV